MTLREDIGVKNIREFHRDLGDVLRSGDDITLDFSNVRRIDLSVAQVLMAAQRVVRKNNRSIRLKGLHKTVHEQLVLTGLAR